MKIVVLGAGAIGLVYGWAWATDHDVVHLVRHGRGEALAQGIPLDVLDLRRRPRRGRIVKHFRGTYPIAFSEDPGVVATADLVVYAGHHKTTVENIRPLVGLGSAGWLLLTQNWDGTADLDSLLGPDRLCLGDAKAGGVVGSDGFWGTIEGLDLGAPHPQGQGLAEAVAGICRESGLKTTIQGTITEYLWGQFALTAGLWPSLVEAGSFEAVTAHPKAGLKALDAVLEAFQVLQARGVDLDQRPELAPYRSRSTVVRALALTYLRWAFRYSEFMKRNSAHGLGDPREVAAFYGDLRRVATQLRVPTPVLDSYRPALERFVGPQLSSML